MGINIVRTKKKKKKNIHKIFWQTDILEENLNTRENLFFNNEK